MQNYSVTYVGIIVIIVGWLGFSEYISNSDVSILVDNVLQLIGVITAIVGRYKAGGISVLGVKK